MRARIQKELEDALGDIERGIHDLLTDAHTSTPHVYPRTTSIPEHERPNRDRESDMGSSTYTENNFLDLISINERRSEDGGRKYGCFDELGGGKYLDETNFGEFDEFDVVGCRHENGRGVGKDVWKECGVGYGKGGRAGKGKTVNRNENDLDEDMKRYKLKPGEGKSILKQKNIIDRDIKQYKLKPDEGKSILKQKDNLDGDIKQYKLKTKDVINNDISKHDRDNNKIRQKSKYIIHKDAIKSISEHNPNHDDAIKFKHKPKDIKKHKLYQDNEKSRAKQKNFDHKSETNIKDKLFVNGDKKRKKNTNKQNDINKKNGNKLKSLASNKQNKYKDISDSEKEKSVINIKEVFGDNKRPIKSVDVSDKDKNKNMCKEDKYIIEDVKVVPKNNIFFDVNRRRRKTALIAKDFFVTNRRKVKDKSAVTEKKKDVSENDEIEVRNKSLENESEEVIKLNHKINQIKVRNKTLESESEERIKLNHKINQIKVRNKTLESESEERIKLNHRIKDSLKNDERKVRNKVAVNKNIKETENNERNKSLLNESKEERINETENNDIPKNSEIKARNKSLLNKSGDGIMHNHKFNDIPKNSEIKARNKSLLNKSGDGIMHNHKFNDIPKNSVKARNKLLLNESGDGIMHNRKFNDIPKNSEINEGNESLNNESEGGIMQNHKSKDIMENNEIKLRNKYKEKQWLRSKDYTYKNNIDVFKDKNPNIKDEINTDNMIMQEDIDNKDSDHLKLKNNRNINKKVLEINSNQQTKRKSALNAQLKLEENINLDLALNLSKGESLKQKKKRKIITFPGTKRIKKKTVNNKENTVIAKNKKINEKIDNTRSELTKKESNDQFKGRKASILNNKEAVVRILEIPIQKVNNQTGSNEEIIFKKQRKRKCSSLIDVPMIFKRKETIRKTNNAEINKSISNRNCLIKQISAKEEDKNQNKKIDSEKLNDNAKHKNSDECQKKNSYINSLITQKLKDENDYKNISNYVNNNSYKENNHFISIDKSINNKVFKDNIDIFKTPTSLENENKISFNFEKQLQNNNQNIDNLLQKHKKAEQIKKEIEESRVIFKNKQKNNIQSKANGNSITNTNQNIKNNTSKSSLNIVNSSNQKSEERSIEDINKEFESMIPKPTFGTLFDKSDNDNLFPKHFKLFDKSAEKIKKKLFFEINEKPVAKPNIQVSKLDANKEKKIINDNYIVNKNINEINTIKNEEPLFPKTDLLRKVLQKDLGISNLHLKINEYVPKCELPKVVNDKVTSSFKIPDWAKDPKIKFVTREYNQNELDSLFNTMGQIDIRKMFPEKRTFRNDSPNKWVD